MVFSVLTKKTEKNSLFCFFFRIFPMETTEVKIKKAKWELSYFAHFSGLFAHFQQFIPMESSDKVVNFSQNTKNSKKLAKNE